MNQVRVNIFGIFNFLIILDLVPSNENESVDHNWPKWGMEVLVTKQCQINYGPWVDRQKLVILIIIIWIRLIFVIINRLLINLSVFE